MQGVGYPYPNRSHFRSIEIWDTASASSQTLSEGWIAQAFDGAALPKGVGVDSIVIDTNALPSTGPELRTIVMQDAENFLRQAQAMKDTGGMTDGGNPALRHLLAVRQEINAAAKGLSDKLRAAPAPAQAYPQEIAARPPARPRHARPDGARAGGGDQGGAGRLRHPRQPGASRTSGCSASWRPTSRPCART